jgi:hypothetical protein
MLRFVDNFSVLFDNSLAERDICMVNVQQRSPAVSARLLMRRLSAAFAAIFRRCASKAWRCWLL